MNQITLVQAILLSIMALVVGIDMYLEFLFIFRPIIVSTLTGLILGDLRIGLITGALVELSFAGLTPVGGTQPPNPVLAAIMAPVIAHTSGIGANGALGLALPFSFLMQYIILFYYSSFSLFIPKLTTYAKKGEIKKYTRLACLTVMIVGITYAIIVFLCAYMAQEPMRILVDIMPGWLTNGFEVAGGILPAVGFAILLRMQFKIEYTPYLILGFLLASFLQFGNLLPVALAGAAIAMYQFFEEYKKIKAPASGRANLEYVEEDYSNGI